MRFLITIGVTVLVLTMGGLVYAERVMKEDCKTQYNDLKREKSDAQNNYIKSKTSIRTKLGKADSESEINAWEYQDKRLSDDHNNKMEDMKQEMENLYNDPSCWK
jgi:hypothetical protein